LAIHLIHAEITIGLGICLNFLILEVMLDCLRAVSMRRFDDGLFSLMAMKMLGNLRLHIWLSLCMEIHGSLSVLRFGIIYYKLLTWVASFFAFSFFLGWGLGEVATTMDV